MDSSLESLVLVAPEPLETARTQSSDENASDPRDKGEKLAAANARIVELVLEINLLVEARLRLSELQHEIAHLSEVKSIHERAVGAFTKAACTRRDDIIRMIQKARANPVAFAARVRKEARRNGPAPVAAPLLVAAMPHPKALKMRVKIENAWHRKYEVYHARAHWSLSRATEHVRKLLIVRDELSGQENSVTRRTRIAEEGVILITETIEELKAQIADPPHHIYTDSWKAYEQLWQSVRDSNAGSPVAMDTPTRLTYPGMNSMASPIVKIGQQAGTWNVPRHYPINVPMAAYANSEISHSNVFGNGFGSLASYHVSLPQDTSTSTLPPIEPAELDAFAPSPYIDISTRCQITTDSLSRLDLGTAGMFGQTLNSSRNIVEEDSNYHPDSPFSVLSRALDHDEDTPGSTDTPGTSPEVASELKVYPTRPTRSKSVVFLDQVSAYASV